MSQAIISLVDIHKTYPGVRPTPVLRGINLDIKKGGITAIIGQSGSGKTTLMNIMGTLDRSTKGTVTIAGVPTESLSIPELAELRNQTLGFVFQFHHLLPQFTVLENVLIPDWIHWGKKSVREGEYNRARELLELVGLKGQIDAAVPTLSGGQQQRVAVARALMNRPPIILADEPTGNLDSINRTLVFDLFRKINQDTGTTFVLVTHDQHIAAQADRRVAIADGIVHTAA